MLFGTTEELHYHAARATEEFALSARSNDPAASRAHHALATLHRSRVELVDSLLNRRRNRAYDPISRTDKEG